MEMDYGTRRPLRVEVSSTHIPVGVMGAARELKSIRKEIKRLNEIIKTLRTREAPLKKIVYDFLSQKGMQRLDTITVKSVAPKQKRKTIKEKKRDAFMFLQEQGIDDVEGFWKDFQSTQKVILQTEPAEYDDREVYDGGY
jgi:hypothetical protein